ncbi:Hypothetical predicted protein [Mytilus galloprovincialis]|uniref:Uncharacterized protein n=1 Tax=Mytilus galloprovincialis TaxID=29158 RepID=A0A8B6CK50_MYTGA|nr:Hypothetical predicted protein [Mytilus galloprovincialis]
MVIATTACVTAITNAGESLSYSGQIAGGLIGGVLGIYTGIGFGTRSALAGALGASIAGGAIAGAIANWSMQGTLVGAAVGGTAALGVGGSSAGLVSVSSLTTEGIELLVVGTTANKEDETITYDCWKPVIHDKSDKPSNGIYLKDLLSHECIQRVTKAKGCYADFPHIVIENIWKEEFEIEYMILHTTGKIVCHAKQI